MNEDLFLHGEEDMIGDGPAFSRRDFLRISGSGLFICFLPGNLQGVPLPQPGRAYPTDLNAYLKIGEDGRVTLFCSKIEMGQGIYTSMAQLLAEELEVSPAAIDRVMGDTDRCPWDSGTTGSRSTKYYGPPLRRAGAEAKAVLLQMAAEKLGAGIHELEVKNGVIYHKRDATRKVSYGGLVKGKQIVSTVSDVVLKPVSQHRVAGKPMKRADSREKVTGRARYAADILLPGMLYARVLRPPSHGARLVSADTSQAGKLPGVVIVREGDLIAALHEQPEAAEKALTLVKAEWEVPDQEPDNRTIFDYLRAAAPAGHTYTENGDLTQGRKAAIQSVQSEFYNHYVAHTPIEPYAVVAHVEGEKATLWASSQAPFRVRETAAEALNSSEEQVHVMTPFVGGGFGGKKSGRQIREAVLLSKKTGRPVQLAWSRQEEFFYDAFRPAAIIQLESGLNAQGQITYWDCNVLYAGSRSSEPVYNIPHYRVSTGSARVHPFDTGAWRGPGSNTNVFAMESHTDMLAKQAGSDPYTFRMNNLSDGRMIRVLKAAAGRFGHKFEKGPSGKGYGIACTNYLNTYVATMAHVTVNKATGRVKVERVVCAQDMGEIINPQGARLQIESGITMGISAALYEEVEFSGGSVHTNNFGTYRITRFSDVPAIEAVLIDNPELPPQGCGEPAITTMGAALANAIFDATGARMLVLPMTPRRILAALGKG